MKVWMIVQAGYPCNWKAGKLTDTAEKTGYSISTVSRVLTGADNISRQTRRQILAEAEKYGCQMLNQLNNSIFPRNDI